MLKAIIFDLWGTLAEKRKSFVGSCIHIFKLPSRESTLSGIENALMKKKFRSYGQAYNSLIKEFKIKPDFRQKKAFFKVLDYEKRISSKKIYKDVVPTLKRLGKRYKIALISNTPSYGMEFISKLSQFFDADIRSYNFGVLKPDTKIFLAALKKLQVKPYEAVMVGDTFKSDIQPAAKLGLKTVMISRPEFKRSYLKTKYKHKPTISSLKELESEITKIA